MNLTKALKKLKRLELRYNKNPNAKLKNTRIKKRANKLAKEINGYYRLMA